MKRAITTAAAILTSLALAGSVEAGPGGKGGKGGGPKPSLGGGIKIHTGGGFKHHGNHPSHGHGKTGFGNYHLKFGKSFSHGFCYHGKHHCHWTYSCWWPKYGCNAYWCPSTCCYYYWCESACCYYPISYIAVAPPVVVQTAPVVVQTAPAVVSAPATPGGPPAGIPPLPQ